MRESNLPGTEGQPLRENYLKLSIQKFNHFFKKEKKCTAVGCGILSSLSLYAISKKVTKKKRLFLAIVGGFLGGGICFYFNKKQTGLIDRSFCSLNFWLDDTRATDYLKFRINIKKKNIDHLDGTADLSCLSNFLDDIKASINKKYYRDDADKEVPSYLQLYELQAKDLFKEFDKKIVKTKKVRIFDQYISFNSLCSFINSVEKTKLLYFLRYMDTIKYNLQGELILNEYFESCPTEHLAAFLAFGYYSDTCGKFLYLQPDTLMTFLENAVYFMYYHSCGERRDEESDHYKNIAKKFEKYCKVKIAAVEFKKNKDNMKIYPTKITIEKIKEGQALRE